MGDLRKAFAQSMQDPELRAEVVKLTGEDVDSSSGAEMEKLIAEMYATPEAVAQKLRDILSK